MNHPTESKSTFTRFATAAAGVFILLLVFVTAQLRAGSLPTPCQIDPCGPTCCPVGAACCDGVCCETNEVYCCADECISYEDATSSGCLTRLYVKWNSPCTSGPCNGSSWERAFHEVQDALDYASTSGYIVGEIWVAGAEGAGHKYYPDQGAQHDASSRNETFFLVDNVAMYGGFAGTEDLLSERDPNPHRYLTILSGEIDNGTSNSFRVVTAGAVSSQTVLDGFVIQGGRETHSPGPGGFLRGGAGLAIAAGSPTVRNCIFRDNYTATMGGAVRVVDGHPRFANCQFTDNSSNLFGGALYASGNDASVHVLTCLFDDNVAKAGGAIYLTGLDALFYACTLAGNVATGGAPSVGGGIYSPTNAPAVLTINSSILWDNQDSAGQVATSQIYSAGGTTSVAHSTVEGGWTGNVYSDVNPFFVDAANRNFRLKCYSPSRNLGDPDYRWSSYATINDLDHRPRISTCWVDRGAFEIGRLPEDCNGTEGTFIAADELQCPEGRPCGDCNQNRVPDVCDVVAGTSENCNDNSLPDECEANPGGNMMRFTSCNFVTLSQDDSLLDPLELPGDFTIETWVYVEQSFDDVRYLVSCGPALQSIRFVNRPNTPAAYFAFVAFYNNPNSNDIRLTAATPIVPRTWTHYALTRSDGILALYVNGELDDSDGPLTWAGAFAPRQIGSGGLFPTGSVDEVRIWNDARTPEEIRENFRRIVSPLEQGLVAYWTFDESLPHKYVYDSSPTGRHGSRGVLYNNACEPSRFASNVPFLSADCDGTSILDECEVAGGTASNCEIEGVPAACWSAPAFAHSADSCIDAVQICPGAIYTGATTEATLEGESTCFSEASADVWYRYTPIASGTLTVSVCGSAPISVSMHNFCLGQPMESTTGQELGCWEIACSTDPCSDYPHGGAYGYPLLVDVVGGHSYWIRIAGDDVTFQLEVTGPDCARWEDCNSNGSADTCDIADGESADCNSNGTPDECEIEVGHGLPGEQYHCTANCAEDCNSNGVPDECDSDCNENGVADDCDIARGLGDGEYSIGGPIIIGGDDAEDDGHGGTGGGWLYIQEAFNLMRPEVRNGKHVAVCLGCQPGGRARDAFIYGFDHSQLPAQAWTRSVIVGTQAAEIPAFFDGTGAVTIADAGVIYMPSSIYQVSGGIGAGELAVIGNNAEAIATFVAQGGGLFVHDQSGIENGWSWLQTLLPGIQVVASANCNYNELCFTAAGQVQFPELNDSIVTSATPWHSFFEGELGGLQVLVVGECEDGHKPVIIGGSQVTFTPSGSRDCNSNGVPDECDLYSPDWHDADTNGILDECEVEAPTAAIEVLLDCDTNQPVDVEQAIDECELICIDGLASDSNIENPDLEYLWDFPTNGTPDFAPPDILGPDTFVTWTSPGCPNGCTENSSIYTVALRVRNAAGGTDVVTRVIEVRDLAPDAAALSGPTTRKVGQEGCYEVVATSPCDPIVDYAWTFELPGGSFVTTNGPAPDHLIQCFTWPENPSGPNEPYEVEVAVAVTDSDGDTLADSNAVLTVTIAPNDAGYLEQSGALAIETAYHAVETDPVESQFVRHWADMRLRNTGEVALPGPFAVVFSELAPTGTELLDGDETEPPASPVDPYRIWELGAGERLEPGSVTAWLTVTWRVPSETEEAGLSFNALPYTLQQPPQFDTSIPAEAWEGERYSVAVHAEDPEGDVVYYELGEVPAPPPGMTLHRLTGALRWTPAENFCGSAASLTQEVLIIARDGFANSATSQLFTIDVQRINREPSIDSQPDLAAVANATYDYDFAASDPDGDEITLTVIEPAGMVADPTVGQGGTLLADIDWLPSDEDKPGQWVLLVLDDGEYLVEQEYFIDVLACPSPPTIAPIDSLAGVEGQVFRHQLDAGHLASFPNGPYPYFWLDPAPSGMMVTSNGLIEWLPWYRDHGTRLVRAYASYSEFLEDGCFDTETFTVAIEDRNIAPVFEPLSDDEATEGRLYSRQIQADDDDGDPLRYVLLKGPEGMTIDPFSGIISWSVPQWAAGVEDVRTVGVRAIDTAHEYTDASYALAILAVQVPPEVISVPVRYAYEQVQYTYTVSFRDQDHPPQHVPQWNFEFVEHLDWLAVSSNGWSLVGTPPLGARFESPYHVLVQVQDDTVPGLVGTQPFDITVYSPVMNTPPAIAYPDVEHIAIIDQNYAQAVLIKDADQPVEIGFDFVFEVVRFEDQDDILCTAELDESGEARCESGEVASIGFALDTSTSGWINWQPVTLHGETPPQTYLVGLWVKDGDGNWSYSGYTLTVFAADEGEPPAFLTEPGHVVALGETFDWRIEIADPDVPAGLRFEFAEGTCDGIASKPLPAGMELEVDPGEDPRGADLLWTPTANQMGQYCVSVTVTDADSNSISLTFALAATASGNNSAPQIDSTPPDTYMVVNQLFEYDLEASDPDDGDVLTFSLEGERPTGATIDPVTGLFRWTPTAAYAGTRPLINVRVTDSEGLWHEQWFSYYVYPSTPTNLAPDITTVLGTVTRAPGQAWTAAIQFTDNDSTAWTARVLQGPPSLGDPSVNPATKTVEVNWTPTVQDTGLYSARLRVTDAEGAFDEIPFILDIADGDAPRVLSTAPATAHIGTKTEYLIVTDQDDQGQSPHVISYRALRKPAGADVDVDGVVSWTPVPAQVGENSFIIRITNSLGSYTDYDFEVVASDEGTNLAPTIHSDPVLRASSSNCASDPEDCYVYAIQASDDESPYYLSHAVEGPAGIAFDRREKNLLRWDVSMVGPGTYPVTVTVTDRHSATAVQHFDITVSPNGMNRAPEIRSAPVTSVRTGTAYAYPVAVDEPDGDTLDPPTLVSVLPSAAGLAFSGNTLTWNPAGSAGAYEVTWSVADEHGAEARQSFVLSVHADASGANQAPLIVTEPITRVVRGRLYEYIAEAFDPDGPAPALLLVSGPSTSTGHAHNMSLTSANGVANIVWQTDPADPALPAEVVILATDEDGAGAVQRFTVELTGNTAPRIRSIAPPIAVEEAEYEYVLDIVDPEDGIFDCIVVDAGGVNPSPVCTNGAFTWTPSNTAAQDEPYEFEIQVADAGGATDRQRFAVLVREPGGVDLYPPDILVTASLNPDWSTAVIAVRATDDVGIASTGLIVTVPGSTAGTEVAVDLVDGAATVVYPPSGSLSVTGGYEVLWTVVDTEGNRSSETAQFLLPTTTGGYPPEAEITHPIGDEEHLTEGYRQTEITEPTLIHGRAYDLDNDLYRYELAYRRVGDSAQSAVVFAEGTDPVGSAAQTGILGEIDPTRMENGLYEVTLTATDLRGVSRTAPPVYYSITGNLKVGHFTMSFEDISVPVSGIPISVTRTYDSRNKTTGDFGVGWRMEFASLKLQETARMGDGWQRELGGSGGNECFLAAGFSHSVTVTWPDGRSEIFEFRPSAQTGHAMSFLLGYCEPIRMHSYEFKRTSTGTSSLDLLPGHGLTNQHWVDEFGVIGDISGEGPSWQPQGYLLTTGDGTKYEFQRTGGAFSSRALKLTTVTDRNGNVITFDDSGVHHSAGKEILIQRVGGRIRRITDPAGKSVRYEYDTAGNLTNVIDQEDQETRFRYNFKHELVEVRDGRGIPVAKNVYDDEGRLVKSIDAQGFEITQEYFDDAAELATLNPVPTAVANPDGDPQQVAGAQRVTDRIGRVMEYHYDARGNVIRERKWTSSQDYQDTEHVYDARGNELYTIYAEPAPQHPDAENADCPAEHAATGNCLHTRKTYDDFDNVLTERDLDGNTTTYTYNAFEQVRTITTPDNRVTTYQYDEHGNLTKLINPGPDQTFTEFTYDDEGDLEHSYDAERNDSQQVTNELGYVTQSIDALGNVTEFEYDDLGRQTQEIRKRRIYGVNNGEVVPGSEFENLVSETFYDGLGRVVRTVDPLGHETLITYNRIGKQETVTTVNGTATYDYDARGDVVRTTHPDGSTEETRYDREGRCIATKDRDGRWTWTEYDVFDRAVRSYLPTLVTGEPQPATWPHSLTEYDKLGRTKRDWGPRYSSEGTDEHGTRYAYLPNKRKVIIRADVYGVGVTDLVTTNGYDRDGRLVQTTDSAGNTTKYRYDELGRQTKVLYPPSHLTSTTVGYDRAGRKTAEIDQAGKRTEFRYDKLGRLTAIKNATPAADQGITQYHYDELGNRVAQTDAEGRITIMQYDALSRLTKRILPLGQVETFAYDTTGNMTAHTDFNLETSAYTYDVNGRMRTETAPSSAFSTVINGPVSESLRAAFRVYPADDFARIEVTHDFAALDYIRIEYDDGELAFDVGAAAGSTDSGIAVTWTSPPIDRLLKDELALKIRLSSGEKLEEMINGMAPAVTEYDYLASGMRTQAGEDTYGYDDRGRLAWEVKATGDRLDYAYDADGNRTLLEITPDGESNPTSSTAYAFDHLNRLTSVTDDGGVSYTLYDYDTNGNRAAVTYPNGTVAEYTYDAQNRLRSLVNKRSDGVELSRFAYTVGAAGNRTDVVETLKPVGDPGAPQTETLVRTIHYEYDELYRLTREHVNESTNGVTQVTSLDVTYQYDHVGNREVMIRDEDGFRNTTVYQYDHNDRLTSSVTTTTALTAAARDKFDRYYAGHPRPWTQTFALGFAAVALAAFWMPLLPWSRLIRARGASPTTMPLGHRTYRKRLFTACVATFLVPLMVVDPQSVDAAFTEAIRVQVALTAGVPLDCAPGTVCMTYGYDDNGNQVSRTQTDTNGTATDTYIFDHHNRLVGAVTNIGTSTTALDYTYDADGIRTSKTVNKVGGTYYLTDKNQTYAQVVEERSKGGTHNLIVAYTYGDDLISQYRPFGAQTRYYHYDGQMSTRQLTDAPAGIPCQVTDQYSFDGFGLGSTSGGNSSNDYLYTGEQYDVGVAAYYLRTRYYAPQIARFYSRDIDPGHISEPLSLHKYIYAHANPIDHVDPSGKGILGQLGQLAVTAIQSILTRIILPALTRSLFFVDRLIFWVLQRAVQIQFYILAGSLALYGASVLLNAFSTYLLMNMKDPPDPVNVGGFVEEVVGANKTEYEVIDHYDEQSGTVVAIRSHNPKGNEERMVNRISSLADQVGSKRVAGFEPKREFRHLNLPNIPNSAVKTRSILYVIPQNYTYMLRSSSLKDALTTIQRSTGVIIRVVPLRRWRGG